MVCSQPEVIEVPSTRGLGRLLVMASGLLVMASALYSTPLLPSDASDQRSGPVFAAAPLALVDATQEPSKPPQPTVQLQVGATANAVMCGTPLMPVHLSCRGCDPLCLWLSCVGTYRCGIRHPL